MPWSCFSYLAGELPAVTNRNAIRVAARDLQNTEQPCLGYPQTCLRYPGGAAQGIPDHPAARQDLTGLYAMSTVRACFRY